jgi:hypothetical protein
MKSDEWKRKQALRITSDETRQKMSKTRAHIPLPEITRLKMRLAKLGKKRPDHVREAIRQGMLKYHEIQRRIADGPFGETEDD